VREVGRVYYIYILASRINGTLYVGVTNDLWVWRFRGRRNYR
jgi:predicted GIY-YIG superfamily endonuclease